MSTWTLLQMPWAAYRQKGLLGSCRKFMAFCLCGLRTVAWVRFNSPRDPLACLLDLSSLDLDKLDLFQKYSACLCFLFCGSRPDLPPDTLEMAVSIFLSNRDFPSKGILHQFCFDDASVAQGFNHRAFFCRD